MPNVPLVDPGCTATWATRAAAQANRSSLSGIPARQRNRSMFDNRFKRRDLRILISADSVMRVSIPRQRKILLATTLVFAIYSGVHCINSVCGGYCPLPEYSRYDLQDGYPTTWYWQPRYGYYALYSPHNDWLGCLFIPLIQLDRAVVHYSLGGGIRGSYDRSLQLRTGDIHPNWRAYFIKNVLPGIEEATREGKQPNVEYL